MRINFVVNCRGDFLVDFLGPPFLDTKQLTTNPSTSPHNYIQTSFWDFVAKIGFGLGVLLVAG